MTGETSAAAAVCVLTAVLATLLKQYAREHAMFCTIAACITVGVAAVSALTPIAETLRSLYNQTALPTPYFDILWKSLGICYLTSVAGDLCRDCGESALAQMAELWGRLALVLLALPLLEGVLEMVTEIL